jgi:rare lipoprotein A (peptidoglycan hydrolase)
MTIFRTLAFGFYCAIIPATGFGAGASSPPATTGIATYYTVKSCQREGTSGILTASGKRYDETAFTCALPERPPKGKNGKRAWGRTVRITNLQTNRQIICRQTDFGPGRKARSRGVIVDLTPAAFEALGGALNQGRLKVKVEVLQYHGG